MSGSKTNSGENLRKEWDIPALQARYHKDGTWFMPLECFPAALCDSNGYVVFETQDAYFSSPYVQIGDRVNVRCGISKLQGYVRVK